jgi:hypothetical protein
MRGGVKGQPSREVKFKSWMWTLLVLCLMTVSAHARSLALAWEPNSEEDVVGYKLHYGTESGNYTAVLNLGTELACSLHDLPENTTYYFAVTAYNSFGIESDFSEELSWAVPAGRDPGNGPFEIILLSTPPVGGGCTVTWQSHPKYLYRILSSDGNDFWRTRARNIKATGTISSWTDRSVSDCSLYYDVEMVPYLNTPIRITSIVQSLGVVAVTWRSERQETYRVFARDSAFAGDWTVVSEDITATDDTICFTESLTTSSRFYLIEKIRPD